MKLPLRHDSDGIEGYVASLFRRYPESEHEAMMTPGQERQRLTLSDLHGELMFVSRQRRFQVWADGMEEPDWLGDLYREVLPGLAIQEARPVMLAEHEEALRAAYHANLETGAFAQAWGRKSPRTWLASLQLEELTRQMAGAFPDKVLSREVLRRCLWNTPDSKESALLVLAWGEMRVDHARRLLAADVQPWVNLVARLRASELTRKEAYSAFRGLAESKSVPGLGPAYFTKLIYFLRYPDADEADAGFIMDQWTATSINLLFGDNVVKMDKAPSGKSYVSARNTAGNYERFCQLIEYVAHQWRARAEHVEMTLFGRGGKHRDPWRQYVLASLQAEGEAVPADEFEDAL